MYCMLLFWQKKQKGILGMCLNSLLKAAMLFRVHLIGIFQLQNRPVILLLRAMVKGEGLADGRGGQVREFLLLSSLETD